MSNGDSYSGGWQDDLFHGRGVYRWASGETYDGEYVRGERAGRGRWQMESLGESYEGEWARLRLTPT